MLRLAVLLHLGLAMAAAAVPSYFRDVRPILGERCAVCHQQNMRSGRLSLATHAALMEGGLSGPAIKPAAPDASPLLQQISGSSPKMPKAGRPLSPEQVRIIREWIEAGAPDDTPAGAQTEVWWSLRPLVSPTVPAGGHPVDAFVTAALKASGLNPSAAADRRTLIRRVTLDLHGLAPAPEEVEAFVQDRSPQAYERLVDRLLESPRYGERWTRHWLDVVHYGDTHGYDKDKPRPNAWPYRDYVIRALNADKPYSRFVKEQIAGDVLFPETAEGLIATGFISAGPWDFVGHQELREGTTDKNITRLLDRDDMVAATMSTFNSMTAHCARCHDHKFDPIRQEDYYSLQAAFAGVDRADQPYDSDPAVFQRRRGLFDEKRRLYTELQPLLDRVDLATSPEIAELDSRIQDARAQIVHIGESKTAADAALKKQLQERMDGDTKQRKALVDALVGAETYAAIDRLKARVKPIDDQISSLPKPEMAYSAASFFPTAGRFRPSLKPRPVHLLARGSVESPGKPMEAGALSCLPEMKSRFGIDDVQNEGRRRAALADWITDPRNVLTWRSIVNRVWHHHFGVGIVDTPNDFGRMGSKPTHPELLDWLAVWFRDEAKGSLKKLHRLIVTSGAYQQSSSPRADAVAKDSDNRLLWRMNRIRLDAETVRDSVLAAAGKLDLTMGGPAVRMFFFKDDHSPIYDYTRFDADSPGAGRRSIYRFVVRSAPDPFMERLDCPDPSLLTAKRNVTLTAIQALALLNNPLIVRMSEHFAGRLMAEAPSTGDRVRRAARVLYGREPTAKQLRDFSAYADKHGFTNLCRLLFNTNEFLFAD